MKITTKLFFAIFGLTALVLVATLSLARWSFKQGFLDYINALEQQRLTLIAASIAKQYQNNASALASMSPYAFERMLQNHTPNKAGTGFMPPPDQLRPPKRFLPPHQQRPPLPLAHGLPNEPRLMPATVLVDTHGNFLVGNRTVLSADDVIKVAVSINQQIVAELWSEPKRQFDSIQATEFAKQQQQTSLLVGLVLLLFAALLALILAKLFVNPIKLTIHAIKQLANGKYQLTPLPKQADEMGQLMRDIERLAHTLAQTQQAKNRWLANISHELRTPLTILTGELEMVAAGIRPFDQAQQQSFQQEVHRLMALVDDLYQLSLADIGGLRYQFSSVNLTECIEQALATTASKLTEHQLTVHCDLATNITMQADPQRLTQLFINLIVNSCYYTDAPGTLAISVHKAKQHVIISFADSAPSVEEQYLPLLFDSLHRQDDARTRSKAGAGLGLTICKTIVEAHQGSIVAKRAKLGGLAIVITFNLDS